MNVPPNSVETARRNRLLTALDGTYLHRLLAMLEPVPLPFRHVVFRANDPIEHVHFPVCGAVSLTGSAENDAEVEVATIGREGMVGLSTYLGARRVSLSAIVQIPGSAMRMRVGAFEQETRDGGPLSDVLRRYTQALFVQVAQVVVCNRLHSAEERLARWLLMSHDRAQTDEFSLTHEFMARMLGVRRATVTEVAGALQQAGTIRYSRGRVTVLDRARLQETACECYGVIERGYDEMFG